MGEIVQGAGLSEAQLVAVAELEAACAGDGRLKLEWPTLRARPRDSVRDLLWIEGGEVVGFLGLYRFGFGPLEVTGMVHPAVRRRGIGRRLLAAALDLPAAREAALILLVTDRRSSGGVAFGRASGGVVEHSEHFMTLGRRELPPAPAPARAARTDVTLRPAGASDGAFVGRLVREEFGVGPDAAAEAEPVPPEDLEWTRVVEVAGKAVGCLRAEHAADGGYIAGFVIEAGLRGQGIGRAALRLAVAGLLEDGAWPVALEVETENDHALGLYLDTGFEVVSTMDYFTLPRPVR